MCLKCSKTTELFKKRVNLSIIGFNNLKMLLIISIIAAKRIVKEYILFTKRT